MISKDSTRALRSSGCSIRLGLYWRTAIPCIFPSFIMAKKQTDLTGTKPAETVSKEIPASTEKRRPIPIRIGDVSASIWLREVQVRGEMRTFYSVTFERSYRDRTGAYQYTKSFDPSSLGQLVAVIQKADEYFRSLEVKIAEQDAVA